MEADGLMSPAGLWDQRVQVGLSLVTVESCSLLYVCQFGD